MPLGDRITKRALRAEIDEVYEHKPTDRRCGRLREARGLTRNQNEDASRNLRKTIDTTQDFAEAKQAIAQWIEWYNIGRPH